MFDPGRIFRLRSGGRSDAGRVRDNNEDSIHLWQADDHRILAVVADGMGGAVAGEEASRIVIDTIQADFIAPYLAASQVHWDAAEIIEYLKTTIRRANANIIEQATQNPELKGMGTTVTLACIDDERLIVGHVGDSRAYLISGASGEIQQVTSDHSFVQALVKGGHLSPDEAEDHPMSNVLYRALGQALDVEIDIYERHLLENDRLVLCSDGLTLHVKAPEIAAIIAQNDDPQEAVAALIETANERGGRDNISVIVIRAQPTNPADDGHATSLDDTQDNPLHGNEHSVPASIPRENSNMGASEPPRRITQTQETIKLATGEHEAVTVEEDAPRRDSPPPDIPGEGRDHLLPEQ